MAVEGAERERPAGPGRPRGAATASDRRGNCVWRRMNRMATTPIIDCDCHHAWPYDKVLLEYMPAEWRDYFSFGEQGAQRRSHMHPERAKYPTINGSAIRHG